MSIQKGIRKYGDKEKDSAMKESKNLTMKNNCFGEIDYKRMAQKMKDQVLPLLIFMVMKRNSELKSRECANESFQRVCTEKSEVLSLIPDFRAFKYVNILLLLKNAEM